MGFCSTMMLSCEKEVSMTNQSGSGNSDVPELLIKTIDESPQGSIVTEYKYDHAKKLVSEQTTMFNISRGSKTSSILFFRDTQGRITKTAHKYDQPVDNILYDTVITLVYYEDPVSRKIHHTTTATTANGITVYDSVRYLYSALGKVVKTEHYTYRSNETRKKGNWFSWEFNSAGNLVKMEQYSDQTGTGIYGVDITYLFDYDDKVNPYYSGDDIRLETDWYSASPNNVIKQTVQVAQTHERYENLIFYDQHDIKGRPTLATHTPAFAPVVKTTFVYQ